MKAFILDCIPRYRPVVISDGIPELLSKLPGWFQPKLPPQL